MEGATLGLERQQYPLDELGLPGRNMAPRQGLLVELEGVVLEDDQITQVCPKWFSISVL